MFTQQGFPQISAPFIDPQTYQINQAWLQLLITLWSRTGSAGGSTVQDPLAMLALSNEDVPDHSTAALVAEMVGSEAPKQDTALGLALVLGDQPGESAAHVAANLVNAGPSSGATAKPTYRSLVGADLPNPAPTTLGGVKSLAAVSHNYLTSIGTDGTPTQAQPAASDLSNGVTGTGAVVLATTPTLITPVLGAATATSVNKVTITAPASSATLTIADGKTLTVSNTATVSGTNTGDQTITLTGDATGSGTGSFATTVAAKVPTGAILDFGGASPPTGFLACDGSAVSRTTYSALFTAIGVGWGVGDGSTTFNVPNFNRRVTVGSGGTGTATLGNAVGNTGGEETHVLTIAEMPAHTHLEDPNAGIINKAAGTTFANGGINLGLNGTTGSTGGGGAHNIIQPSAIVLKIIKT